MSRPPLVLLLSADKSLTDVLSPLLARELGVVCVVVASEAQIPKGETPPAVLLASQPVRGRVACPVVQLSLPLRVQALLTEVRLALAVPPVPEWETLGEHWAFSRQGKWLQYIPADEAVALTDKEIQIIQSLAKSGVEGVSREALLKDVWGIDSALDTHTLETHIYRLRAKMRELAGDAECIATSEGGYRFLL